MCTLYAPRVACSPRATWLYRRRPGSGLAESPACVWAVFTRVTYYVYAPRVACSPRATWLYRRRPDSGQAESPSCVWAVLTRVTYYVYAPRVACSPRATWLRRRRPDAVIRSPLNALSLPILPVVRWIYRAVSAAPPVIGACANASANAPAQTRRHKSPSRRLPCVNHL